MAVGIILMFFGVFLIVLNYRAIVKEKSSFTNIFHDSNENMKEYEVELNKLRRDFSETITELQLKIEELSKKGDNKYQDEISYELYDKIAKHYKESSGNVPQLVTNEEVVQQEVEKDVASIETEKLKNDSDSNNKSFKVNEIKELFDKGLSLEEITKKTGISKGEVLLIKELYIR